MEAQRVISVSLGKIAQSRLQRAGCSLHKSLMVASILHKARHLYVEQTFTLHCRAPLPPPPAPPAAASEPEAEEEEGPTYTDLDACQPAARGVADLTCPAGAETDTTPAPAPEVRRKRLISDEETEEAVASILPKRARTDNGDDVKEAAVDAPVTTLTASSEDSAKESRTVVSRTTRTTLVTRAETVTTVSRTPWRSTASPVSCPCSASTSYTVAPPSGTWWLLARDACTASVTRAAGVTGGRDAPCCDIVPESVASAEAARAAPPRPLRSRPAAGVWNFPSDAGLRARDLDRMGFPVAAPGTGCHRGSAYYCCIEAFHSRSAHCQGYSLSVCGLNWR